MHSHSKLSRCHHVTTTAKHLWHLRCGCVAQCNKLGSGAGRDGAFKEALCHAGACCLQRHVSTVACARGNVCPLAGAWA
eukprot:3319305-Alexandrium_andersonii.AAC.1